MTREKSLEQHADLLEAMLEDGHYSKALAPDTGSSWSPKLRVRLAHPPSDTASVADAQNLDGFFPTGMSSGHVPMIGNRFKIPKYEKQQEGRSNTLPLSSHLETTSSNGFISTANPDADEAQ